MSKRALFAGLVFNPDGDPAGVDSVGGEAQYAVLAAGFSFRVPAEAVDRQVLAVLGEVARQNRDAVADGAMKMMGQDDLFTKALIDASLNKMDENLNKLLDTGLPENALAYLGMLGLKIIVDHHGEVLRIDQPGAAAADDE